MPGVQQTHREKVVSLSDRRRHLTPYVQRISPEFDGIELLYTNDRQQNLLFSLKVLAWGMFSDGSVTALVPWLNRVMAAPDIADPLNGCWIGYRLPDGDYAFTEAPEHKVHELTSALALFGELPEGSHGQEIPDTIGTHAVFSDDNFVTISLVEVISWRLDANGSIEAMVACEDAVTRTPVLPGDPCLVPVQQYGHFCYYFQHGIANKLKEHDPEAMAAIAVLASNSAPENLH